MHITSGLSPTSGEMLDTSGIDFYGDAGDHCGLTYFSVDHAVPESSHTVEIEYVYEHPDTYVQNDAAMDTIPVETVAATQILGEQDDRLCKTIKENKKPAKPTVDDNEADLTNLTWLQNITNIMSVPQFPLRPVSPSPPEKVQNSRLQKFHQTIAKCQKDLTENKEEYQTNSTKKPPYSYSTLICMAMRYNNDKMTLSAIYSWIREHFKYYRNSDPTWQNSIRHNLSLNKVFVKEARSKHEPGKGGFWKLDLAHLEGTKRISNRPRKKKKCNNSTTEIKVAIPEEKVAVENIPGVNIIEEIVVDNSVTLHIPEFNINALQPLSGLDIETNLGANVIVKPVTPPPLIAEDDLSSLLLNPTDWDDIQLDMLDNYLDSCFK